jgi:hypothetical protein
MGPRARRDAAHVPTSSTSVRVGACTMCTMSQDICTGHAYIHTSIPMCICTKYAYLPTYLPAPYSLDHLICIWERGARGNSCTYEYVHMYIVPASICLPARPASAHAHGGCMHVLVRPDNLPALKPADTRSSDPPSNHAIPTWGLGQGKVKGTALEREAFHERATWAAGPSRRQESP